MIATIAVSGCQPEALIHDGAINDRAVAKITQDVQHAATMPYLRPVSAKLVTLATARKFFDDSTIDEFGGKANLRALSQIEVDLGIAALPENCQCDPRDYLTFQTRSQVSQVAIAYETSPDSVAVINGSEERFSQLVSQQLSLRQKVLNLLAHPLTVLTQGSYQHVGITFAFAGALIDQHFGTTDTIRSLRGNSDESAAVSAVKEGEKSLIYDAISRTNYDAAAACDSLGQVRLWDRLLSQLYGTRSEWLSAVLGSVSLKEKFVCEAYKRGGWTAVNGLYRTPPRSMQQVLHPSLYYIHPLFPVKITLAGYEGQLRVWTKMYEDTYGETWLSQLLGGSSVSGAQAATQWAGDRMVLLQNGDRVGAIWLIVFRDKLSATTFRQLYQPRMVPSIEVQTLQKNNSVLVAIGDADFAKGFGELAPEIWRNTKIRSSDGKEGQP